MFYLLLLFLKEFNCRLKRLALTYFLGFKFKIFIECKDSAKNLLNLIHLSKYNITLQVHENPQQHIKLILNLKNTLT